MSMLMNVFNDLTTRMVAKCAKLECCEDIVKVLNNFNRFNLEYYFNFATVIDYNKRVVVNPSKEGEIVNYGGISAIVFDIDGKDANTNITIEEFKINFPFNCVIYTTTSHTETSHSFRVIVPLYGTVIESVSDVLFKAIEWKYGNCCQFDKSQFAKTRLFKLPYNNAKIEMVTNKTEFLTVVCDLIDDYELNNPIKPSIEKNFNDEDVCDVSKNEKVVKYLETSYFMKHGNGDSNNSLYVAICVCIKANDELTLDAVLYKARLDGWSERELQQKLRSARG